MRDESGDALAAAIETARSFVRLLDVPESMRNDIVSDVCLLLVGPHLPPLQP